MGATIERGKITKDLKWLGFTGTLSYFTISMLYFYFLLTVYPSFFMPKFKHKEMMKMFSDEILERIFADNEMKTIPLGCQSTAISVIERVLEEIREENPYATASELFSADE